MIQCKTLIKYHNIDNFVDDIVDRGYFSLYENPLEKVFIIKNSDIKLLKQIAENLKTKYNFKCNIKDDKLFIKNYSEMKNLLTLLKLKENN